MKGHEGLKGEKGEGSEPLTQCFTIDQGDVTTATVSGPGLKEVHFELQDLSFRVSGIVPTTFQTAYATANIIRIPLQLDIPQEIAERLLSTCSVGVWTCCARRAPPAEGNPQPPGLGISNSGSAQIGIEFPGRTPLLTCKLNFDERLFIIDEENQVTGINTDYVLDDLSFVVIGEFELQTGPI